MTATASEPKNNTKWFLVLSLLVGPVSWSAFFLIGYLVAEAACITGILQGDVAGINLFVAIVVGLGLIATAVCAWGSFWSYRRWRSYGEDPELTEDLETFLALAATLLNVLFLLATVTTALGILFVLPCRWI